ncbi:MAG: DNA-3-methyladenine glycosylase 2 family protein [Gemmatimonadota bacterium]
MLRRAVTHLKQSDPVMARIIAAVGPCRFATRSDGSHYQAVFRSILYQQLAGAAALAIHRRVQALYGGRDPAPEELLGTPDETLRAAGLSRQKLAYLRDLSARIVSGEVVMDAIEDLPDSDVISTLTRVKGVGRWTAEMFLIFRLGRPDILPDLDLGIRNAIKRAYRLRKLPDSKRVHAIGSKWAPYRSIATWYLWRSIDGDAVI